MQCSCYIFLQRVVSAKERLKSTVLPERMAVVRVRLSMRAIAKFGVDREPFQPPFVKYSDWTFLGLSKGYYGRVRT